MKKLISVLLMISMLFCSYAAVQTAEAASAAGYTLTTVDERIISAAPVSPDILNVVLFSRTTDGNTKMTLDGLSNSTLVDVDRYHFCFADFSGADRSTVADYAKGFSPKISFCYGVDTSIMWNMIREYASGPVTIPVIVFINRSGVVADVAFGFQSTSQILEKIKDILGDEFIEPAKNPAYTEAEVEGEYYTNIGDAIARVNEIRYEACKEGVPNPNDPSVSLTLDDYRPVVWSSDLEEVTRLRAAEATIRTGHTRPNGERCFTANTFKEAYAVAENLAWNRSKDMVAGINQFYSEKADYLNNTGRETGHYTSIINPDYNCIGAGGFYSNCGSYPSCLCLWLATAEGDFDQTFGQPTKTVSVPLTLETKYLYEPYMISPISLKTGETDSIMFLSKTRFDGIQGFVYLREDVTWISSDDKILTVTDGTVQGVGGGTATVTATSFSGLTAKTSIKIIPAPTEPPTDPPTEPPTDPPTEPPTKDPNAPIVRGDSDGDGDVTIIDATAIQRKLASILLSFFDEIAADVDGDGDVTIIDATSIQRHLANFENTYGIGSYIQATVSAYK